MNLTIVIDSLKDELTAVADLGDERASAIGRRLAETLGANLRLRLLDILSQAALELSSNLPSGHVEVRLAGQDPQLVFVDDAGGDAGPAVDEELSARITLRLSEALKASVEAAATHEGISVNAWIVRELSRTVHRPTRGPRVGNRLTGFGRS